MFIFLCLTYFTYYNALKIHPRCLKWQDFLLFMANEYASGRTYRISSLYSSVDGHLACFHDLAAGNKAAANTGVQMPFQGSQCVSL